MECSAGQPIRVLHVLGNLGHGGAESRVIDLYRCMDRARVQFDFAVHCDGVRSPEYFDETVRELGGNIYVLPRFKVHNLAAYKKAWADLFASHKDTWRVVQGHMTSTAAIYLPIAKEAGVPITIAHARSAGTDPGLKGVLTQLLRSPLRNGTVCDHAFACTGEAAEAVFGRSKTQAGDVTIIPNAIDIDAFTYDESARVRIRAEFDLSDAVVIGHVGRLHYAKNHEYLFRVFKHLREMSDLKLKLLLVGGGDSYAEEIRALPSKLMIEEDVIFAGDRSDVSAFYAAFDYFVFPSRYEGLPGTVIEAQACSLMCLISDTITDMVDVTPLVQRSSIMGETELWARQILDDLSTLRNMEAGDDARGMTDRKALTASVHEQLREAGFDVKTQAVRMMEFYESGKFDA